MIKTTNLEKIKQTLQNGNLCVIPTDTILGIFANANNYNAVKQVFVAKKRDFKKPIAIFLPNIEAISKFGIETEQSKEFVNKNLPGAYTILLKATNYAKNTLSEGLISHDEKIGIRIPMQKDILQITKEIIICGTSVNISGLEFAKTDVPTELIPFVETFFIKDMNQMKQEPSKIIDFSENTYTITRF